MTEEGVESLFGSLEECEKTHAQYELFYEDGFYKVDAVFAAPPAK